MSGQVDYTVDGGIATIALSNPERRNALSSSMIAELAAAVSRAETTASVRVIALTGTGGHFCAGADLTRFAEVERSARDGDAATALARATKPTVALIEGSCFGGGALLALACDLRLASQTARFGLPPARLGIVLPLATVKRLVDVVGAAAARDLLFTARTVEAAEAARIGLVGEVYAAEEFAASCARRLAAVAQNSPLAVQRAKALITMVLAGQTNDTAETLDWVEAALSGPDLAEGQAAFREKRPPRFPD